MGLSYQVAMRQFPQELTEALKPQSMPGASLEVVSHNHINLEDKTEDFFKR